MKLPRPLPRIRVIFPVILLLLAVSPATLAVFFDVEMDDIDWQLHEDKYFTCSLSQKVPLFGTVAISAEAGHQLFIELESSLFPTRPESVQLWIKPQPWGAIPGSPALQPGGPFYITDRRLPISQYYRSDTPQTVGLVLKLQQPVRQLLDQLDSRSRLYVRIVTRATSQRINDPAIAIDVSIPTVGMLPVMEEMSDCIATLLPKNYQQLHQYNLHYALGKFRLTPEQRQWLLDTARYVAVDQTIKEITIDGNSDNTPFTDSDKTIDRLQNLELSKMRADTVRNQLDQYLQEAGVTRPLNIVTRYHGDRYPVASNATAAGRYQNRRVDVTLLRTVPKESEE